MSCFTLHVFKGSQSLLIRVIFRTHSFKQSCVERSLTNDAHIKLIGVFHRKLMACEFHCDQRGSTLHEATASKRSWNAGKTPSHRNSRKQKQGGTWCQMVRMTRKLSWPHVGITTTRPLFAANRHGAILHDS